jgi:protein-S-isoprenylcysteine O-methyltransferase Ste14
MPEAADTAGVAVRPPMLYLGTLGAAIVLDLLIPARLPQPDAFLVLGIALAVAGSLLFSLCADRFRRAGTNVPTWQPATALVIGGPYRYSRNPIYVAQTLIYLGLACGYGSAWPLALLPPVLVVMQHGVIRREERYLEARFGPAYRAYSASVRRWL